MRLTRAAACRSLVGCVLALTLTAPALAQQPRTVLDLAAQQKNLSTFVAAVHTAGLDDILKAAGPITVYAPTDAAFAKLSDAERSALLSDPARLKALITGSIINQLVVMHDGDAWVTSGSIASVGGRDIVFGTDGERSTVGGAHVVQTDLRAENGSITTVDKVLLP